MRASSSRAASAPTPPPRPGSRIFAVASLEDGTATRSALAIADAFAQLGADYGANSARDASVLDIDALATRFPAALSLLADIVRHPAFPDEEIERARRSRLASLAAAREDPGALADAAFRRALYGADTGYGQPTLGTEDALTRIDGPMLRGYWEQWFRPDNAALVIVGAIDRASARALAEREFGGWSGRAATLPAAGTPLPAKATSARVVLVPRAGVNQTELRIGRVAATRASPDYFALQLANEVLGGGYTSRLNANIREAKGYAYGAFSRFEFGRLPAPFVVATAVRADATAPAVQEIDRELERMRTSAPSRAEFAKARDGVVRALPGAFDTNGGIAGAFANLFVYGLANRLLRRASRRIRRRSGARGPGGVEALPRSGADGRRRGRRSCRARGGRERTAFRAGRAHDARRVVLTPRGARAAAGYHRRVSASPRAASSSHAHDAHLHRRTGRAPRRSFPRDRRRPP